MWQRWTMRPPSLPAAVVRRCALTPSPSSSATAARASSISASFSLPSSASLRPLRGRVASALHSASPRAPPCMFNAHGITLTAKQIGQQITSARNEERKVRRKERKRGDMEKENATTLAEYEEQKQAHRTRRSLQTFTNDHPPPKLRLQRALSTFSSLSLLSIQAVDELNALRQPNRCSKVERRQPGEESEDESGFNVSLPVTDISKLASQPSAQSFPSFLSPPEPSPSSSSSSSFSTHSPSAFSFSSFSSSSSSSSSSLSSSFAAPNTPSKKEAGKIANKELEKRVAEDSAEKQRQAEVRRKLQEEALTENIALTKA